MTEHSQIALRCVSATNTQNIRHTHTHTRKHLDHLEFSGKLIQIAVECEFMLAYLSIIFVYFDWIFMLIVLFRSAWPNESLLNTLNEMHPINYNLSRPIKKYIETNKSLHLNDIRKIVIFVSDESK